MELNNTVNKIITKIHALYPNIAVDHLKDRVLKMNVVTSDLGNNKVMYYNHVNNTLQINPVEAAGNYDLEYYFTFTILSMLPQYNSALEGLRSGYYAGIANNLVGNFVSETTDEIKPGIDIYEPLRDCIISLSEVIGPDLTSSICENPNENEICQVLAGLGLTNPAEILNQMNYLYDNSTTISNKQVAEMVQAIKTSFSKIKVPEMENSYRK